MKKLDVQIIGDVDTYTIKINNEWVVNRSGLAVNFKTKDLAMSAAMVWVSHHDLNINDVIDLLSKGKIKNG